MQNDKFYSGDVKEILEGLQIEEEGLLGIRKAKLNHDAKTRRAEVKSTEEKFENNKEEEKMEGKYKESDTKTKSLFKKGKKNEEAKSINLDDEFEQVEPKYFVDHDEQNGYRESSRARIHDERRRRIEHTGDSAKFEILETEKLQNKSESQRETNPDEIRQGMKIFSDKNFTAGFESESISRIRLGKRIMKKRRRKLEKNSEGEKIIAKNGEMEVNGGGGEVDGGGGEGGVATNKAVKLRHQVGRRHEKKRIQRRKARARSDNRR